MAEADEALRVRTETPPAKVEVAVVVALSCPTVSKDEVAFKDEAPLTMTIPGENAVLFVPPLANPKVPVKSVIARLVICVILVRVISSATFVSVRQAVQVRVSPPEAVMEPANVEAVVEVEVKKGRVREL